MLRSLSLIIYCCLINFYSLSGNNTIDDGLDNFFSEFECSFVVTEVNLVHASVNTLSLEWADNPNVTSWEIGVTQDDGPPTIFDISFSPFYTFENLDPNTLYHLFIRSICDDGVSLWSDPFQFYTQKDYCNGDHFFDDGGETGWYSYNATIITTLFPDHIGEQLIATFEAFDVYNNDTLKVFDGPSITYPLVASLTGEVLPDQIIATDFETGALTFLFTSDGFATQPGWDISFECRPLPPCEYSIEEIEIIDASTSSLTIDWSDDGTNNTWELKLLTNNASLVEEAIVTTLEPYTFENLDINTEYLFNIRTVCDDGFGEWYGPYSYYTLADFCNDDHFYDSGGEFGNYSTYENITRTIFPQNQGERLIARLNLLDLHYLSALKIYDGPNDSYPLITELTGYIADTRLYVATEETTGALTFVFESSFGSDVGWDISFLCEPFPACPTSLHDVRLLNASNTTLTVDWSDSEDVTQWEVGLNQGGGVPTSTIIVNEPIVVLENLEPETQYDFYIRSVCAQGVSTWLNPYSYRTQKEYCNGENFYDSGGADENHSANESFVRTIYPQNTGDRIVAAFNYLDLASGSSLKIHDGPSIEYPLMTTLYSFSPTNPDAVLATDEATGALTFSFNSGSSSNGAGWDVNIFCEPFPNCETTVESVFISHASSSSLIINWTDDENINEWEIGLTLTDDLPETILTVSNNSYTFENLDIDSEYGFYIRSICQNGVSSWIGPYNFRTQKDYCNGDHFYDSGGAEGYYSSNETTITTIFPEDGDHLLAYIHLVNLESFSDYLYIYDGPDISFNLIHTLSGMGENSPSVISATNQSGALTFQFISDEFSTRPGWDISFGCEAFPTCTMNLEEVELLHANSSSLSIEWSDDPDISSWEIALSTELGLPTNPILVPENQYTFENLELDTEYLFYVRSICESGLSDWYGPYVYRTQKAYCDGTRFYDSGGSSGGYAGNALTTTTIFPEVQGEHITALFNFFDVEDQVDFLSIYNGPDASFPLMEELTGEQHYHAPIVSSDASGALTFVFESDPYNFSPGWDISIICDSFPACSTSVSDVFLTHANSSSLNISWTDEEGVSEWEIALQDELGVIESPFFTENNHFSFTSLLENHYYYFYIKSICASGASDWLGPFEFKTQKDYCDGAHFFDTGGNLGNYGNNEDYSITIFPDYPGQQLLAYFKCFDTQKGDIMSIYDGPNSSYPLIEQLSGEHNNHDFIASTDTITGALTFTFTSNESDLLHGWDLVFVCQDFQLCPYTIQNIRRTETSFSSLTFEWDETGDDNSWEIYLVEHGQTPTNPITTSQNPYTFENLAENTSYDFYINSICDEGLSGLYGPYNYNTFANFCDGNHFYDSGGANNNYSNNEDYLTVIGPENEGEVVTAVFNSVELVSSDIMRVYDGPDPTFPLVWYFTNGTPFIDSITSTHAETGALTFSFQSNGFSNDNGWDISLSCREPINCANTLNEVELTNASSSSLTINWSDSSDINSWNAAISPQGFAIDSDTTIFDSSITFENLLPNTIYDIYLQSICPTGLSELVGPFTFSTTLNYCNEGHFLDSGGLNDNYNNDEEVSITIYPTSETGLVQLTFLSFSTEPDKDILDIYDGPNASYPLLMSASGNVDIGSLTATNSAGALTCVFTSDESVTGSGWDALVDCIVTDVATFTSADRSVTYYPNPSRNIVNIESAEILTKLEVFDLTGRLIESHFNINTATFNHDVSMLDSGMYYYKAHLKSGKFSSFKIIKM